MKLEFTIHTMTTFNFNGKSFTLGEAIERGFGDLYSFNRDWIKELFSDGQERITQAAEEGILGSSTQSFRGLLQVWDDSIGGDIDYSGTILSGNTGSDILLDGQSIQEIIDSVVGTPITPIPEFAESLPTPDSFLYFMESLPEGGWGVYNDSVYAKQDGAVVLQGDTSIIDNDFEVNNTYYYDPDADNPSVDYAADMALALQPGEVFNFDGSIYEHRIYSIL